MAKDFLKPVYGGSIIDTSCGSGLFSRLFARSGLFSLVVALDYSENMLQQCYEFIQREDNMDDKTTKSFNAFSSSEGTFPKCLQSILKILCVIKFFILGT